MNTQTYWFCVLMFVLGQAAHLFLVKIPAIKSRCRNANKEFVFKEWWISDWYVIIGTQIIGALCIFGLDEIISWKPGVVDYVKWFFAGIGAFGSTIAMAKASQFEKSLQNLVDVKTNLIDNITGGTKTTQETLQKAEELGIPLTKQ